MIDGLIRVAAVAPRGAIASPEKNVAAHIEAARNAARDGAHLIVFPELSLSSCAIGDLVMQTTLLAACEEALMTYCKETSDMDIVSFVGIPVRVDGKVYSCAAVVSQGELLGLVPKSYVARSTHRGVTPYRGENRAVRYGGQETVFGTAQLFAASSMPSLTVAVEIGEDMTVAIPPSCRHAAAGATMVACLAAEPELIGAASRRRTLIEAQSARTATAYVYAGAGEGESGTDGVYAGHALIAHLGTIIAESAPFGTGYAVADMDMEMVLFERSRRETYETEVRCAYRTTAFAREIRPVEMITIPAQSPFVPVDPAAAATRCETILHIQACALAGRMQRAHAKTLVFGASGGLDSTLAQLVCVRALTHIGRPATETIAVTMPCFGTTARTRSNAERLAETLGVTFTEVDIKRAVEVHFADIGHDPEDHTVVYENAQARERTQVLMDIANKQNGMVVGTGDLSELALGWATYNGDHMSMYGVNAGIPKTLMRHIVGYEADRLAREGNASAADVLRDILATPVSPELLPPKDGEISQRTENIVGPYELHDFFLYYTVRWGFAPHKIYRYAVSAFRGVYDEETIRGWLTVFTRRFFAQQFKRSCLADGPAVGTVSLSPRGAWSMPSDALSDAWIEDLK